MRRLVTVLALAALTAGGFAVVAPSVGAEDAQFSVPGTAGGPDNGGTAAVSTGIVLTAEKWAVVTATGSVNLCAPGSCNNDPDGGNPGNSPSGSLVPNSPFGCLAARVGSGAWECIGSGPTVLWGNGELQLAVNDSFVSPGVGYEDNTGEFDVAIDFPRATITIRKTVAGTDPGTEFPVTVACAASGVPADVGSLAADGEIVLGDEADTGSTTVKIPAGGSKTVDVWWVLDPGLNPQAENITCTVTEDLSALPAGASCTASISPSEVVLYDQSDKISRDSASVVVTNTCSATPVTKQPTFTG